MDIAAEIAVGRKVIKPMRQEIGFGTIGHGPASDMIGTAPAARVFNFYWPDPYSEESEIGTVIGDLTPAARGAVERKALAYLQEIAEDAPTLLWRCEPEWETERAFDTNTTRHCFRMRGAFIWDSV